MELLTKCLLEDEAFHRVAAAVENGGCPALLSGTGALPRAHAAAALYWVTGRPLLAICADEGEADRFRQDLYAFSGVEPLRLYGRDFVFYNADVVSREGERRRIDALDALLTGRGRMIVATPEGLCTRTMPPDVFAEMTFEIENGGSYDVEELTERFIKAGYSRSDAVEGPGQFSRRGGILDFFSPGSEAPVRCEFFGDQVDSMGYFDISSQRRTDMCERARILPVREAPVSAAKGGVQGLLDRLDAYGKRLLRRKNVSKELLQNIVGDMARIREGRTLAATDRYLDLIYEPATALDYLPGDTLCVMCEPGRLTDRMKNYVWQLSEDLTSLAEKGAFEGGPERLCQEWDSAVERLGDFPVVMMAAFTTADLPLAPRTLETMTAKQLPGYGGSLETAAGDIKHYMNSGLSVMVLCKDKRRAEVLREYLVRQAIPSYYDFEMKALPRSGSCMVTLGSLSAGLEYPNARLAIISEGQITGELFRKKARHRAASNKKRLESYADLAPGDLVVHDQYGIGRFVGLVTRQVDGVSKDYIKIAYQGTDALYVPATQLDMISKYIGAGEDAPVRLSKLGGTDWARTKLRAKGAVKELAEGLIKLQAERKRAVGFPFSPDSPWQREFEDNFEYQETDD
ncbi:MAG: transcription-repair coupling factor, partial [Oscillospiraceae bacterium]|nr:transcription-repair coupling factor [Oscillospiraceae bacterium]